MTLLMFGTNTPSGAEGSGVSIPQATEIKELLEANDRSFFSSFTIDLIAEYPIQRTVPEVRLAARTVRITSDGACPALHLRRDPLSIGTPMRISSPPQIREKDGTYRSLDTVGLIMEEYIYLGSRDWRLRHNVEQVKVGADNTVTASKKLATPLLEVFPVGQEANAGFAFYRYITVLGRGYARYVDDVEQVSMGEDGIAVVEATGRCFASAGGRWRLEIDTTKDYLVRRADYIQDGKTTKVSQSGKETTPGPIPVYTQGAGNDLSVKLTNYTREVDLRLLHSIQEETSTERGKQVLDFNTIDPKAEPR